MEKRGAVVAWILTVGGVLVAMLIALWLLELWAAPELGDEKVSADRVVLGRITVLAAAAVVGGAGSWLVAKGYRRKK